jgi:hypothetical protein
MRSRRAGRGPARGRRNRSRHARGRHARGRRARGRRTRGRRRRGRPLLGRQGRVRLAWRQAHLRGCGHDSSWVSGRAGKRITRARRTTISSISALRHQAYRVHIILIRFDGLHPSRSTPYRAGSLAQGGTWPEAQYVKDSHFRSRLWQCLARGPTIPVPCQPAPCQLTPCRLTPCQLAVRLLTRAQARGIPRCW